MNIFRRSFIFEVNNFEEYQDGLCMSKGACKTTVIARVINEECIEMSLQGTIPVRINARFKFPILGIKYGDVLDDRVQYGRIPYSMSWSDSNDPVVCNIFNNMTCIRFAMMSPLRIVEFFGKFTDISD